MMFVLIVIVDIEHREICERCEWLNNVLIEYLQIKMSLAIV